MSREATGGHLDLLLLAVIGRRPMHGYGMIDELRRRSNETFDLAEGTVYPALYRLEKEGLVRSEWDDSGSRRRRVYELTRRGERRLARERADWSRLSAGVAAVLGGAPA